MVTILVSLKNFPPWLQWQSTDGWLSLHCSKRLISYLGYIMSFSSTIIRNCFELQKSLSVPVQASVGFGAVSFSTSSSYKKTLSEVSSGEKLYITSLVKCSYHFSEIDYNSTPPPLNPGFYRWVKALERNTSKANLLTFVKYYVTHIPTSVVFGARFKSNTVWVCNLTKQPLCEISVFKRRQAILAWPALTGSETCFENRHCLSIDYITDLRVTAKRARPRMRTPLSTSLCSSCLTLSCKENGTFLDGNARGLHSESTWSDTIPDHPDLYHSCWCLL